MNVGMILQLQNVFRVLFARLHGVQMIMMSEVVMVFLVNYVQMVP